MTDQPDPNEELTLYVDYDPDLQTHYVVIRKAGVDKPLLFKPDFASHEDALEFGDMWMKRYGFVVKGSEK